MDLPFLRGPDGRPVDPNRTFLIDQYGNPLVSGQSEKNFAIPAHLNFAALISGAEKTYLANNFDEAMKHSRENAMAMWRDCRIRGWLDERIESVVNLKWHLEVDNEKDPAQKFVKDGLTLAMRRIPRFDDIVRALMKSRWYGRYATELCWEWEEMDLPAIPDMNMFEDMAKGGASGGMNGDGATQELPQASFVDAKTERRQVLMPFKNRPLNGDKINFMWGYTPKGAPPDTPLLRVYAVPDLDDDIEIVHDNVSAMVALTGHWRERFVIAKYNRDDADYFLPEMAGGIHGVGIRSVIYWLNWVRMDYASWINDLFDRLGLGFIIIKYDMGSTKAREEAEKAARHWSRRSVMCVPVTTDQLQNAGSIEVVEVPVNGAVVVQEFVKYCDKFIERYILRHTMSGGGPAEGDGARGTTGPSEMAKDAETQRIKSDARDIAETITGTKYEPGVVSTMQKYTYPKANFPVRFVFDVEDESPKEKLQGFVMASGLGATLKAKQVRAVAGAEEPEEGDETCGGKNKISGFGEDLGGEGDPDKKEGGAGPAGGDASASRQAAEDWLAQGKQPGVIEKLSDQYGVSRQSIGSAAKRLEGGGA